MHTIMRNVHLYLLKFAKVFVLLLQKRYHGKAYSILCALRTYADSNMQATCFKSN